MSLDDCEKQIKILTGAIATTRSPLKRSFYEGQRRTLEQMRERLARFEEPIDVEFSDAHAERTTRAESGESLTNETLEVP